MLDTNATPISPPADGRPAEPSTLHVQSLLIGLDGITAGDYLTWVRDPEPPALDHRLRSVAIGAEPLGDLVNIELVWAGQPPTAPGAAALAAGFALTPEVVEVQNATRTANKQNAQSSRARHAGSFSKRASQSEPTTSPYQRRRGRVHRLHDPIWVAGTHSSGRISGTDTANTPAYSP
jgi:hypothetical protein